jgi:hypothetical protein
MPFNPTTPDQYIGKQLILNSDRIVINSKEDNLLFSNTGFSFSTNGEFHFNTENKNGNKFVVNSPKIHLGLEGTQLTSNPAVKGKELENILTEVLDIIDTFYKVDVLLLNPIAPPVGPCAPDATFPGKTSATQARITNLKARLKEFQSDKVYLT